MCVIGLKCGLESDKLLWNNNPHVLFPRVADCLKPRNVCGISLLDSSEFVDKGVSVTHSFSIVPGPGRGMSE